MGIEEWFSLDTLIFSASVGAGHDQVARALQEEILYRHPTARVSIVDTISYISPFLNKLVLESYLGLLRFTPRVWGKLYEKTEGERVMDFGALPYRLLSGALTKVIHNYSPQAIICTHAFSAGLMATLKRREHFTNHLSTVVTDFTVHPYWIHEGNDLYFVAHENLLAEFVAPRSRVSAAGIPILSKFARRLSRSEMRKRHNLAELPTVLVMGGSLGLGDIKEIVEQFDKVASGCQILVVTGRNEILRNELRCRQWRNRTRIYGFVDYVNELMAAADVVVTKPGGVTSAEALSQGKPLVFISPIPGQEDRNSTFLTQQGAAVRLSSEENAGLQMARLLADAPRLAQLGERAMLLARPRAASTVIDRIEQYVFA